jgi:hypothetical protein
VICRMFLGKKLCFFFSSTPVPSLPPSSLTHVHRCISYRNPNCP